MKARGFDIEDIQKEVVSICDDEFGPSDGSGSYIVENTSSESVRQIILQKMKNQDMAKMKYLDMVAYVLDVGNQTIINIA